jgi:hypothetical protein
MAIIGLASDSAVHAGAYSPLVQSEFVLLFLAPSPPIDPGRRWNAEKKKEGKKGRDKVSAIKFPRLVGSNVAALRGDNIAVDREL